MEWSEKGGEGKKWIGKVRHDYVYGGDGGGGVFVPI